MAARPKPPALLRRAQCLNPGRARVGKRLYSTSRRRTPNSFDWNVRNATLNGQRWSAALDWKRWRATVHRRAIWQPPGLVFGFLQAVVTFLLQPVFLQLGAQCVWRHEQRLRQPQL